MNKKDVKNTYWNIIGSSLNAISSLVFLIIVTRINGVEEAGIFTYGYATACLFYTIAVYYGRTYQVTESDAKLTDSDFLFNRGFTILITMLAMFIFCLIMRYSGLKFIVLMLLTAYRCTDALAESFYAIIQKDNRLNIVGISMTLKALIGYIMFFITDLVTHNIILATVITIICNILIIIFFDIYHARKSRVMISIYTWQENIFLFKKGFFAFALSFLGIYVINAPRYAIDSLLADDMQTIFGIIVMPAMVMSLLSQFIIHPFLVRIRDYLATKDYSNLKKIVDKLLGVTFVLGCIVILCAYIMGIPVLNILYGLDLTSYKIPFMIIMVGSLCYAFWILISNLLIAMRVTFKQVIILGIASIIAYILSNFMILKSGIMGASISYSITMFFIAIFFIMILYNHINRLSKKGE